MNITIEKNCKKNGALFTIQLWMARKGRGKQLFEEGDYFKYFGQRGEIIRLRQLIEGWLFKEIHVYNEFYT